MTVVSVLVDNPKDFVSAAERSLAAASPKEYAEKRRGLISQAAMLFGHDVSREVEDALPDGPAPC